MIQELGRYEFMDDSSPESQIVHQYLDWIAALPWGVYSKDKLGITQAERVLNHDHYGLDDVKKRIEGRARASCADRRNGPSIICQALS